MEESHVCPLSTVLHKVVFLRTEFSEALKRILYRFDSYVKYHILPAGYLATKEL